MSQEVAIAGGLLNAFLWGSWAVLIKRLHDYPLDAYFIVIYLSSFVLVWALALIALRGEIFVEIGQVWARRPMIVLVALGAGAAYIVGIRITLTIFSSIGLAVTAPIQTLMNLVLGTSLAALVGGVPAGISTLDLAVVCSCFLVASLATIQASILRDRALPKAEDAIARETLANSRSLLIRNILLAAAAAIIITSYPLGLSYSLKTPANAQGLTPWSYSALLVTGSLLSALVIAGVMLTRRGQWPALLRGSWTMHRYAIITSGAHYGGNVINAFATGVLTAAVSWPLGTTSQLWTYVWGLAAGEFKQAPRKSYVLIAFSAALFVAGILYLRWALAR